MDQRAPAEKTESPIRVLVVEDHQMVAEGLSALLDSYDDLHVLGWVPGVRAAIDAVTQCQPDVALIDFRLPDGSGAEAATGIRDVRPETAIVFLSADDSDDAVSTAVEAGAVGYFLKTAPSDAVADAIRRAAEGETLIPATRLSELLARRSAIARERAEQTELRERLTPREREVLSLLAQGLDNRALAARLHIEYSTVRSHVRNVLLKLGARTQLEAVVKATALGLLP
jgi:DNA-binding NarL/FixJ family response regulator